MNRIAFLGPHGTFTEEAVWAFGLDDAELIPADSPSAALRMVRAGEADRAVVAIENSVDGAVTSTADALIEDHGVQIYGETELEISFSIMTRPGERLEDSETFATHPVGYQQVKNWVAAHAPRAEFRAASSNAAAAEMVARGQADAAAAPARAAELYGLTVHARGVADRQAARTRFVLVGPRGVPTARTGTDRTFVAFQLPNEPGTLVGALQEFAYRGVDLSRIESRPTGQAHSTYNFFVELVGHIEDTPVAEALRSLYLRASEITYLGSWPRVDEPGGKPMIDAARLGAAQDWVQRAREGK
ncbi:prephenate dehydratase [Corynebacterium liangguodongii]|uniref:Prephenate dehydratase n=1 Tax=Corynebacterium liangguodongii TaxID=2079535 RepID=A0A2S0WGG2_9CORY|nr:prephenate dehydratase [Corynebacterium liangguodongii]AWB84859.1 prephenate dehydratase [Corynebacterium liangguodongii]PWB99216.1 prephenate dehydratase [Corynebacterium liangguodongii]